MLENRKHFFDLARQHLFAGEMDAGQVLGCEGILDSWEKWAPNSDPRFLAYSLGTAYHETARRMTPVRELGKGYGHAYAKPASGGQVYYGRGLVQLTWEQNYRNAQRQLAKIGLTADLLGDPDKALDGAIAGAILVRGMVEGWFTGRKLGDFFAGTRSDWLDARKIINGHDRAALVASYALGFYHALVG